MTIEEITTLCGGHENWAKLYNLGDKAIANFLESSKLDHSEHSFEIVKAIFDEVLEDYRESWYRRSLSKRSY